MDVIRLDIPHVRSPHHHSVAPFAMDGLLMADELVACLFSFLDTPRDAVRFALVCKQHAAVLPFVTFRKMTCAAGDLNALDWIVKHVDRITKFKVQPSPASVAAPDNEDGDPPSWLYRDLKRHVYKYTRPLIPLLKMRAHVLGTTSSMICRGIVRATINHGYDMDTDAYAGAVFAWSINGDIETGASNQLEVSMHVWYENTFCGNIRAEVRRSSDNDMLHRSYPVNFRDTSWTEAARELYNDLAPFENRERDPEDGDSEDEEENYSYYAGAGESDESAGPP